MIRNRENVEAYVTKDRSTIRELFHPDGSPVEGFSVAEAEIAVGTETVVHVHGKSQEIYYILAGAGTMRLGEQSFSVKSGDAILIAPRIPHNIKADEGTGVRILCICSPAYSHDDTELRGA